MSEPAPVKTLERIFDLLSRCLDDESARRVSEFRITPDVQARVDYLAERANEGLLTAEERSEYEAVITTTDFIATLKLQTRRHLASSVGQREPC